MAKPVLRFTPYAFSKMLFLRDKEPNLEVGGFGVGSKEDLLLVTDIALPHQTVGGATVEFDDKELPAFYEDMVDSGLALPQFSRIWIHTHPFDGATPSGTDLATFNEVFGSNDWGLMFILAKTGKSTCRLSVSQGIQIELDIDWKIEWKCDFPASNIAGWTAEYEARVKKSFYTSNYQVGGGYRQSEYTYRQYEGPYANRSQVGFARDDNDLPLGHTTTFQKERTLLEHTSKKRGNSGAESSANFDQDPDEINSKDELSEWEEYQKLAVEEDLDDAGPFSVVDDIPWIL
jgi:proteasome lid subunit RPN8/RPN11